jgi:hypothetical protein
MDEAVTDRSAPTSHEMREETEPMPATTRAGLTFGLALALLATTAWGQTRPTGEEGAQSWFRVSRVDAETKPD